jgi:hypothetical protein
MSDNYQDTINGLIDVREALLTDLSTTVAELAALPAVANFSESGDGGSETIDSVGLRRQLMDEIREKGEQIREMSKTIASLEAGIVVTRIPRGGAAWQL